MKKMIFIILLSIFFVACNKENDKKSSSQYVVFSEEHKDMLYTLFRTEYLWADEVSAINYNNIYDPQTMIDNLKVKKDRWSFAILLQDLEKIDNQESKGFGCHFQGNQIKRLEFNSPCEKAGLQRGDVLLKINGEDMTTKAYEQAKNNQGKESKFTVKRGDKNLDIKISSQNYKYKTIKYKVLDINHSKVAYLIFDSFTETSVDEIEEAFTFFKASKVEKLILDLRYNRGGSVVTASILLDKIAGYYHNGKVHTKLKWNDNYSFNDEEYTFSKDENSLDLLKEVIVLTTKESASASEMIINSLKPYMKVTLVGENTSGKPVGMRGGQVGNLVYFLINFLVYNVNDKGEYFDGIVVDCKVKDEYKYPRDDKKDALFKSALSLVEQGRCK